MARTDDSTDPADTDLTEAAVPSGPVIVAALNTDRFIIPAGPHGERLDITRDGSPVPADRVDEALDAAARGGVHLDVR